MRNLTYTTLANNQEINQVLALQQSNLPINISTEESKEQGFVTVQHDFDLLEAMTQAAKQVIVKDQQQVVGYCLAMLESFQERIPVLKPMFRLFSTLSYQQKPLNEYSFFVMGQVCVAKGYRGKGVFDGLYTELKHQHTPQYDFVVTEVATRNVRSVKAHQRVGFELLHRYTDDWGEEWDIIIWDWRR